MFKREWAMCSRIDNHSKHFAKDKDIHKNSKNYVGLY